MPKARTDASELRQILFQSIESTDSLEAVVAKSMDYPGVSLLDADSFSLHVASAIRNWLARGGDVKKTVRSSRYRGLNDPI